MSGGGDLPAVLPALRERIEVVQVGAEVVLWDTVTRESHLLDGLAGALVPYFDGATDPSETVVDLVDALGVTTSDARAAVFQLLAEFVDRDLLERGD